MSILVNGETTSLLFYDTTMGPFSFGNKSKQLATNWGTSPWRNSWQHILTTFTPHYIYAPCSQWWAWCGGRKDVNFPGGKWRSVIYTDSEACRAKQQTLNCCYLYQRWWSLYHSNKPPQPKYPAESLANRLPSHEKWWIFPRPLKNGIKQKQKRTKTPCNIA